MNRKWKGETELDWQQLQPHTRQFINYYYTVGGCNLFKRRWRFLTGWTKHANLCCEIR